MTKKDIVKHQYKKGQSGNLNGRPKGALNKSTYIKQLFEGEITIDEIKSLMPESCKKAKTILELQHMERLISGFDKLRNSKDSTELQTLLNEAYGNNKNQTELTGQDGEPLQINVNITKAPKK